MQGAGTGSAQHGLPLTVHSVCLVRPVPRDPGGISGQRVHEPGVAGDCLLAG